MLLRRRNKRGFTLVELATVVVIVGVLAVLAVVGYRRYVRASHIAEATNMTKSIRAAQEARKAETGLYADVSKSTSDLYPATAPGPFKTQWGGPCTSCYDPDGWKSLTVDADGPVMFGYATVAGIGAAAVAKASTAPRMMAAAPAPTPAAVGPSEPFYSTVAVGDPDGDGNPTVVYGFSQSGTLIVQGD